MSKCGKSTTVESDTLWGGCVYVRYVNYVYMIYVSILLMCHTVATDSALEKSCKMLVNQEWQPLNGWR